MHPSKPAEDPDDLRLVEYLDGEVDAAAAQDLESRIAADARLRSRAADFRKTWDALDLLDMPRASVDFTRRTMTVALATPSSARGGLGKRGFLRGLFLLGLVAAFLASFLAARRTSSADRELARDLPLLERYDDLKAAHSVEFLKQLHERRLLDQAADGR